MGRVRWDRCRCTWKMEESSCVEATKPCECKKGNMEKDKPAQRKKETRKRTNPPSVKKESRKRTNPPSVFRQVADGWQVCEPSEHSSTSVHVVT